MTTKINLKNYTIQTLTQKKAEGTPAVLNYLKDHVDGVTIQKVNGWLRSGKFPPEVYEAVFANEAASAEPNETAGRLVKAGPPIERVLNTDPEASSEFVDERTDETMPGNMVQEDAYAPRNPKTGLPIQISTPAPTQPRVAGRRHTDIRMREARERGREGIENVPTPISEQEDLLARGIEIALQRLGYGPQNGQPRQPQPTDPGVPPPRKVRAGDNWNTPPQPKFVVQQR